MTEQKIIDGIDVSGCQYYEKGVCSCIDVRNCEGYIDLLITDCAENPNCYQKQLQRKTTECENNETAYKNDLEILNQACADLKNELDNKTAECKKLKEKLKIATKAMEKAKDSLFNKRDMLTTWEIIKQALEQIGAEDER